MPEGKGEDGGGRGPEDGPGGPLPRLHLRASDAEDDGKLEGDAGKDEGNDVPEPGDGHDDVERNRGPGDGPAGGEDEDEVLVVGVPVDRHPRIEGVREPVPLTLRHGQDHFRAFDGRDLKDGEGIGPTTNAIGRDPQIEPDDPTVPVEPDEMEREAHAEGVDRAAARDEKRASGPPAKSEPTKPGPERPSNSDLHTRSKSRAGLDSSPERRRSSVGRAPLS